MVCNNVYNVYVVVGAAEGGHKLSRPPYTNNYHKGHGRYSRALPCPSEGAAIVRGIDPSHN